MQVTQPPRAMMTEGRGRLTHLISKNKQVKIWHRRLGHASNTRVIRASRLLIEMEDFNIEYNLAKVYSDSKESEPEAEKLPSPSSHTPEANSPIGTIPAQSYTSSSEALVHTIIDNDFDSLCLPCVANKQTRIVIQNKPMTKVEGKFDEVHVDLWRPQHPASLSGKTYAAILLNAKTRKTWVIYLWSKDKFVNAFQVWLPKVENECNKSMKAFRADGGGGVYICKAQRHLQ